MASPDRRAVGHVGSSFTEPLSCDRRATTQGGLTDRQLEKSRLLNMQLYNSNRHGPVAFIILAFASQPRPAVLPGGAIQRTDAS